MADRSARRRSTSWTQAPPEVAARGELLGEDRRQDIVALLARMDLVAEEVRPARGREPLTERQRVGMPGADARVQARAGFLRVAAVGQERCQEDGPPGGRGFLLDPLQPGARPLDDLRARGFGPEVVHAE